MEFLKNFFRDGVAESMMRLSVIIIVVNACGVIWYGAINESITECGAIGLGMLTLALGGKVLQKGKEAQITKDEK